MLDSPPSQSAGFSPVSPGQCPAPGLPHSLNLEELEEVEAVSRSTILPLLTAWWLAFAVVRFIAAMFVANPSVFGDELIYWSMARSFHHGLHFVAFNIHIDIPTQLYPLLLSPLFAAGDTTVIYPLVKLVSSLMLCSAVFPAYFLARELLSQEESIAVALVSLLIPGGAYTATVMPENLYYPSFVLAAWLSYRTLYRGRLKDSILTGIAFAISYFVKPHVLFMIVAYGLSLFAWFLSRVLDARKTQLGISQLLAGLLYRSIPFAIFAFSLGIRFLQTAAYGHSLMVVLFGRFYVSLVQLHNPSVPLRASLASATWLLVVMIISTAWVPVLAMIGSLSFWKRLSDAQRWFWVFTSCTTLMFVMMITRHNVLNDGILRTHERYVFQLSPLFFTWYFVARRFPVSRWLSFVAGLFVAIMSFAVARSSNVLTWNSFSDAPTFTGPFWSHLRYQRGGAVIFVFLLCGGLLCILTSAASHNPRKLVAGWAIFLIACNAGWYMFQFTIVQRDVRRFTNFTMSLKATILPTDTIGLLRDQADLRYGWYPNFWLPQPVYYYGEREHDYWFITPLTGAPDGTLNFGMQRPRLLLASDSIPLSYALVREFPEQHLRMYRVPSLAETKFSK
jgi:hypothetical protein